MLCVVLLVVDDPPLGLLAVLAHNGGVYTVSASSAAQAQVFFNDTHSLIRMSFYRQHNILCMMSQLLLTVELSIMF
jgi:uncharacterized membrane protein YidH (DUF202 family)